MPYPKIVQDAITQFVKLPGIGRRSAERIVHWLLNQPKGEIEAFCNQILQLKNGLRLCRQCRNLSEGELCPLCLDPGRDQKVVCVVENPKDLIAIERTGAYRGLYFVLWDIIAPTEGKGPGDIPLDKLGTLIKDKGIRELILATDPDTEGEMTALHLTQQLKPLGVKVSRIGLGIPVGSSVEYADLSTLTMAMISRREL